MVVNKRDKYYYGYFKNEETYLVHKNFGNTISDYLYSLVNIGDVDYDTDYEELEDILENYFNKVLKEDIKTLNIPFKLINFRALALYYDDIMIAELR